VLRTGDFAGRQGGEEFAILLPDTQIAVALEIAERIRVAITEFSLPGADVPITASIGVASLTDHGTTPDQLERLANAALYVAKRKGCNRVELAEPAAADAVPDQPGPPAHGSVPMPSDARALPVPDLTPFLFISLISQFMRHKRGISGITGSQLYQPPAIMMSSVNAFMAGLPG
jgi:hypothetical protein